MRPAREPVYGVMREWGPTARRGREQSSHKTRGFTMVSKRGGAGGVSSALEDVRAAPWDPARRNYALEMVGPRAEHAAVAVLLGRAHAGRFSGPYHPGFAHAVYGE